QSRKFISTSNAFNAHDSDIYAVAVSSPYTITIGGDGYLKLWQNKISETDNPKTSASSFLIDNSGLHHLSLFESPILINLKKLNLILVSVVAFSGTIYFFQIIHDTLLPLDAKFYQNDLQDYHDILSKKNNTVDNKITGEFFWAIEWFKASDISFSDINQIQNKFLATQSKGDTKIWNVLISISKNDKLELSFINHGLIKPKSPNFAMSLAVSPSQNLVATGFQNGEIILSQIDSSRSIYSFYNNSVQFSNQLNNKTYSSSIRSLKFNPDGSLLVAALDSGSFGNIYLYDTKYGELAGMLTMPTHSASTSINVNAHDGWIFGIDFNLEGDLLVSGGYDGKLKIWNIDTRSKDGQILISPSDLIPEDEDVREDDNLPANDYVAIIDVKYIKKGIRGGSGGDTNEGLVAVGFDGGIRWYREAGGI
ncbi:SKI complex subunit WD repeat protein SKI8, partial [Ascoidea rubescens DSM 1968]